MIKRVCIYSLPEGVDGDKFWEYHKQVHAADVLRATGPTLKKYVINRVTKVVRGRQQFFGMMETWWENEETMENSASRTTKVANGNTVTDDFWSRVTNGFGAIVEEVVLKE